MDSVSATWQQTILAHFTPKRERMLLVIDPDKLLRDDALLAAIQNSNYDILRLDDEVAFRNQFERTYRSRWDAGELLHVVVVVHTTNGERHIPYDLWQKSKRVELSVSQLFPRLNALLVRELDNAFYADLYPAHAQLIAHNQTLWGEHATIEFILRACFGLDPVGAGDVARWIAFLVQKHYAARELPPALERHVAEVLLPAVTPAGLRAEFLHDAAAFYAWLGQQWATYVAAVSGEGSPPSIDFADPRLRSLLGTLFAEGLLERAAPPTTLPPEAGWMAVGLSVVDGRHVGQALAGPGLTVKESNEQALYNLQAQLNRWRELDETVLPAGKTDLRDWLDLAAEWAELVFIVNSLPQALYVELQPALAEARAQLDAAFWQFVQERYSAVDYYQDNRGPISLAGVNGWLDGEVGRDERLALVCFDGLALDQWYLLREYLSGALAGLEFDENRTYAIAPTITPVSRQALFAGRPPTAFADTIDSTDKDAERWLAYWVNHDVPKARVEYVAVKVNGTGMERVREIVDGRNRRLGVLVNLFDDVMHHIQGMPAEADKRVYYDTLRSHLDNGKLVDLFDLLLRAGYCIFVTSDHGNIAGVGMGVTPPKALVETFARRVAIFDSAALAQDYAAAHGLRVFRTKALPTGVHPVYQTGQKVFASQDQTTISHGSLSLEELVVPFVQVSRP